MNSIGSTTGRRVFLVTALATRGQKRFAAVIAVLALVAFAAAVLFVTVPLARMPAFIPTYESALFFIDLITAVLLFEQFIRLRSPAVLMLASAYLFDALLIVPHALSFPGAFSPTGLLGAKMQTTAWLYVFWHGGFSLFIMGYALLRRFEAAGTVAATTQPGRALTFAIAAVTALAVALSLLATAGHDLLPVVMQGNNYSLLVKKGVSPAVWALTLIAMAMLWHRPQRLIDLWLMVVMWIWLFDIALAAVIGSQRYDLGFYVGRIYGLIAASFLLITLLVEMARLYAGALGAAAAAEQRFAELARASAPRQAAPLGREKTETFIAGQNIAHYRDLLAAGGLDDSRRRSIENLLAEEEAKLAAKTA